MPDDRRIAVATDADVVVARQATRQFAQEMGFSSSEVVAIATAVSEIGRNMVTYAERGEILLTNARQGLRRGITIVGRDRGRGIPDIQLAMQDAMLQYIRLAFATQARRGGPVRRAGAQTVSGGNPPCGIFPTRGGGPNDYVYVYTSRTNPEHWKRLLQVLEEASERVQVIVLTCHPEDYKLPSATLLDLAAPRDLFGGR